MGYAQNNFCEPLEGRKLLSTSVSIGSTVPVAYRDIGQEGLFVVTRRGDLSEPLRVPLTVSGTAVNGVDYGRIGNLVTIPAGQRSVGLFVRVGASASPANYVRVSIDETPGLRVNARTAVVTILQNPKSPPPLMREFEVTTDRSFINDRRNIRGAFVISRTTDLDTTVTLPINVGGTAVNGRDFGFIGDSVTFLPGQETIVLPIRSPGTISVGRDINLSVGGVGGLGSTTTFNLSGVTGVTGVSVGLPSVGGIGIGNRTGTTGIPAPSAQPRDIDSLIDTTRLDPGIATGTSLGTSTGTTPRGSSVERIGTPVLNTGLGFGIPATRVFG